MKNKKKEDSPTLCECLNGLLRRELSRGNRIAHFNNEARWPHPDTHYVLLINDLSTEFKDLKVSQNISHQI